MTCLNCGSAIDGQTYCSKCGQRTALGRLGWRDVIRDINQQFVEGNLPWFTTLRRLIVDPGTVAREFVEGRRVRYVHPLKFAFYGVLIATLMGWGFLDGLPLDRIPSGWRRFLVDNPAIFWLLMSPIPVVTLRITFFRHRFNTIEIWVFVLYLLGLLAPLFLAVVAAEQALVNIGLIGETANMVFVLGLVVVVVPAYLMWAVLRFFRAPLHWSLAAGLATIIATGWAGGTAYLWLTGLL